MKILAHWNFSCQVTTLPCTVKLHFGETSVFPSLVPEEKSPLKGPKRNKFSVKKGPRRDQKESKKGLPGEFLYDTFRTLYTKTTIAKQPIMGNICIMKIFFRSFKDKMVFSGFSDKLVHLQ